MSSAIFRTWWARAAVVLVIAVGLDLFTEDMRARLEFEQRAFAFVNRWIRAGAAPVDTVVVVVGDDEFWGPELQGRTPISRSYVAALVTKLDTMNAALIALD